MFIKKKVRIFYDNVALVTNLNKASTKITKTEIKKLQPNINNTNKI